MLRFNKQAAHTTGRVKPSELPVQVPVQFELVVNAKTAKALDLELPSSFYWRADEVIE
jgi:putative ABC transport system substrate-binding protein